MKLYEPARMSPIAYFCKICKNPVWKGDMTQSSVIVEEDNGYKHPATVCLKCKIKREREIKKREEEERTKNEKSKVT